MTLQVVLMLILLYVFVIIRVKNRKKDSETPYFSTIELLKPAPKDNKMFLLMTLSEEKSLKFPEVCKHEQITSR